MRWLFASALLIASSPAWAHDADGPGWCFSAGVIAPLAMMLVLYSVGTTRLWRRAGAGRGVPYWRAMMFGLGSIALAGALLSPLHAAGAELFSAHMVEHEIIMAVAAPLLALSRPLGAMLWSLPIAWKRFLGRAAKTRIWLALWIAITSILSATILHAAAIWVWHIPVLFRAALQTEWVHWVQHLGFLLSALLFWWAMFHGRQRERGYGGAVAGLFATSLHTGLLGALLVVSPRVLYPLDAAAGSAWSLSVIEDQQLAGLVMWIPANLVYLGAALPLAAAWIGRSGRTAGGKYAAI